VVGVVLTLIGIGCCAAYTVIARRFVASSDSTAQVVVAQQGYALAFAVAIALAASTLGQPIVPVSLSLVGVASALGSGVLYYAAAYWFYLTALRVVPASVAATAFYLIPAFGVAPGYLLLGDRLQPTQWIGGGIVVLALAFIVRLPQARPARAPAAESALPG
jgi:drug/metabolite transporter (DMT)-like permease